MSPLDFLWPVYGHRDGRRESVATFFHNGDATDCIMHPTRFGIEPRNLYCAVPVSDRRVSGYRPLPPRPERAQLEPVHLGGGIQRVAA